MSRETPYITPGAGLAGLSLLAVFLFAGTATAAAPDQAAIAPGPREETTMTAANAPRQEDPPARPDLTGLHLSGFGMERDSVSVALAAAASRLGRAADYEQLYLRSGNAFAPAIATGESCRSWWHVQARAGTGNLPALAASLGLTAEPLVLPTRPAQDDPALAAWFRTAAAAAAAAMDSGAVLLSDGGWDEPGGWNWAGIVTEVGADAAIRGAALSAVTGDGKEGVAWRYPGTLWAIRPGPTPTTPAEVDRATLRLAVERLRGTGVFTARADLLFGLPAVDRWIAAMKSDRGFCADCFSRNPVSGVHDAPDNDRRMRAAALVVARNLRGGFSAMPPEARLALDQAANCYQRIAQYLSEPLDTKGFYDSLNSLEAQGIYAQRQLWWVRCELAAAAGHFEEALRAVEGRPGDLRLASDDRTRMMTLEGLPEMGYTPDPDPVRLVLAGVPPVSFPGGARRDGAPQMTCFPSCLGAVLRFLEEGFGSVEVDQRPLPPVHPMSPGERSTTLDKSYVLMMGATGAAFRLNWAPDWEPGSDLRWLSDDPWAAFRKGFEAAGRSFELVEKHGMPDDERLFRQRVIASIRQGLPVIALGIIGPPEGCLVSGYDESGAVLTGWSFWQGDAKADPEVGFEPDGSFRKRAWFKDTESLLVLGERGTRPQPRAQHRAALGWALQVMRTPVTHKTRANGIAAFDAWAEALRRDGEFDGQDLAGLKRRMVAHLVATDVIAEGRWYAHNYLKTAALDLPEVKDLLRQAAERCRDEHDLVWEMWRVGGSWQQLGDEAALQSFSAAATRRQLADMVLKLREADREVAAAIEEALGQLVARLDRPPDDRRPDYGKLALAGDHCRQDAFALTMQAAARLFGMEADYDTLHALSTNAFAPDIRPAEPCRCSWAVQGRGRAVDLVAARLGLTARKLDLPRVTGAPDCPDDDAGKKQWLRDWCRLPQVPVIREALERGEVVVCELEWDGRDAFWCDWGILLSASGDGDIQGMTVNGRRDNHIVEVRRDGWALSPAATALAPHAADVEMLRRAVRRIRGEGEFTAGRDSAGRDLTWGLPAMDAWIAQMGRLPYSPGGPQPDRSRAQAPCTALAVSGGAVVAARYLRGTTADFPVPARSHLESAASHYDRIAVLLKPALSGEGGERYAQFMGDLAKQQAHIEMALRPVRSELLAAAAALEQALAATRVGESQAGEVPADAPLVLNGHPYRLEWVSGARLGELRLVGADAVQPRATDLYPGHTNPLHNLHCDVGTSGAGEPTGAALQQQGKSWGDHWRDLALATKDQPFALVAFSEGRLAGHLRFFSADRSRLRVVPEDQQKAWQQPETLFITAGCVDQAGAADRLDAELLRRVIAWARAQGYAAVLALGWSNLRTYAIWGESLPADVYAGAGFSVAARLDADAPALKDMRAGFHGPVVKERIEAELAAAPQQRPGPFAVMQLNLKGSAMASPTVKREGDRVYIDGVPTLRWGTR